MPQETRVSKVEAKPDHTIPQKKLNKMKLIKIKNTNSKLTKNTN